MKTVAIEYVGQLKCPDYKQVMGNGQKAYTAYGYHAFTFDPETEIFYASCGHKRFWNYVFGFKFENLDSLEDSKHTIERPYTNVIGPMGARDAHNSPNWNLRLHDLCIHEDRAYCTLKHNYNVQNRNYGHFCSAPINYQGDSAAGDFHGCWWLGDDEGKFENEAVADWVTPIANSARQHFPGATHLMGSSVSWRAAASNGPSAHAFDINDCYDQNGAPRPWGTKIESLHNLSYVHNGNIDGPVFWTGQNSIAGGLAVSNRIIYFGKQGDPDKRKAYAPRWEFLWDYGYGTIIAPQGNKGYRSDLPPTDAEVASTTAFSTYEEALEQWKKIRPDKQILEDVAKSDYREAYDMLEEMRIIPNPAVPYRNMIYVYDVHGETNREPLYSVDITHLTHPHKQRYLSGISWDERRQRIYVCQQLGSGGAVIHVFKVNELTDPTEPPVEPPVVEPPVGPPPVCDEVTIKKEDVQRVVDSLEVSLSDLKDIIA